jgi:hypothetical protein
MKEKQAVFEGLQFTGIYERSYNREVAKERAKKIRKEYKCRAVLCETSSGGVSVYAGLEYFAVKQYDNNMKTLEAIPRRRESLRKEYEANLAELDKQEQRLLEKNEKLKKKYPEHLK